MDYSRLRATALRDGEAEEAVTVDTRALIDKVLARYSGEWTTLRELIQNAADAQATTVKIKWETLPSTTVPLPSGADVASGEHASSTLLGHTIMHHTLRRLLVENDGQAFAPTDWARLKRIAEGNPDETKIGAFGVGFYSVFADCEEPFVSSGNEAMAFYWKGNALFTRKLVLPEDQRSPTGATTFVLDYRNATTALPNLLSVSQFLASSLTFVALQHIEFWIDDWKILDLHKTLSPSTAVPIPRDLTTRTKDGLMTVTAVEWSSAQIDAVYMNAVGWKPPAASTLASSTASSSTSSKNTDSYGLSASDLPSLRSFFSRLTSSASASASALASQRSKAAREEKAAQDALQQNLTGQEKASITLRVTSAQVKTRVAATFATELERATKKPPPKVTKMAILTSSYDDVVSSDPSASKATASKTDVFASVLPAKKPGGRIFIGFPTMQTTGGGLHVSAPSLIPTVEREAIDLNARWVRNWNMELLRASGILTRLAFINEMADFGHKFKKHLEALRPPPAPGVKASTKLPIPTAADLTKFVPEALHILKTYTFGDSTPSAYVGQIIEEAFWTAYTVPTLDIFSTRGVLSTAKVRMGDEKISQFVDGIPVVVPEMKESPFIQKLHDFGILHDVTIDDVRSELESKPLGRDQLSHFVKWMGDCAMSGELDPPSVRVLLQAAVASIVTEDEDEGPCIIELGTIKNFLSGNKIPASLPLPPSTIPYSITSNIPHAKLQALGWTPLELVPWLEYLLNARSKLGEDKDMTKSPNFASQVLMVLSKNWDNLAAAHRALVLSKLQNTTSIPTKMGMKRPPDAFFPSVKLFDDLPTLSPSCHGLKEKFLVALGVRKTIDLDTIFTRLLSQPSASAAADSKDGKGQEGKKWSHVELAKYLASVRSDIPSKDFNKLLESPICPAEAGPAGKEWTVPSTKLYRANQLFEPSDAIRELSFPIIQWPGPPGSFRRNSPEGTFLISLGLRRIPSVLELLNKMASPDRDLREKARAYYIANHQTNGYASYSISSADKAILPIEKARGSEKQQEEQLVKPSACFTNSQAAILGFAILRADLQPHANKFGVAQNPPMDECVKRLVLNPPRSHQDAVTMFEYFSSRLADVHGESLRRLQQAKIVPVMRQSGWADEKRRSTSSAAAAAAATSVQHIKPSACYLGSSTTYGDIFDFVDFGRNANAFLFQCGSKTEPTKVELARQACKEPARLLSTLQTPERYLNLLRSLAEDLPRLKKDKELFAQMQTAPFLLASKEVSHAQPHHRQSSTATTTTTTGSGGDAEDETPVRQFQLASAIKIAIVDDYISYRLFKDKLMCAPEEDVLETFYMALGAQFLSSIVQEEIQVGRPSTDQSQAEALRKYVLERSKIFLYEYQKYRQDAIRHDHRWLEKHLKVQMVQNVALRRSLRGVGSSGGFGGSFGGNYGETHTEKRSAASSRQPSGSGHTLYILSQGSVDMYQVGQAVCQIVLNRPSQQAYFFFEPFLKLDLLDLRARGYNVDRILRAKQAEARLAEEERRRALEVEQQQSREAEQQRAEQRREAGRSEKGKLEKEAEYAQQAPQMLAARNPPRSRTPEPHMPGAFGDDGSPDGQQLQTQQQQYQQHQQQLQDMVTAGTKRGKDLFSNLTRRLGLDQGNEGPSQSGTNQGANQGTNQGTNRGTTGSTGTTGTTGSGGQVATPEAVQQDMHNAIQSARPYGSSTLFQLPSQPTVTEQATYCDSTQAHDLQWVARAAGGMAVYISRDLAMGGHAIELLIAQRPAIAVFETLLRDVAAVYGLSTTVLHIYYDSEGPTIAFNSGGSIFCNLRFFVQLHAPVVLSNGSAQAQGRVDAAVWWWVVLAHELAHNLEPIHNSRHSFYTESFVQQYFHEMTSRVAAWTTTGADNQPQVQRQESAPPSYQQAVQGAPGRSLLD